MSQGAGTLKRILKPVTDHAYINHQAGFACPWCASPNVTLSGTRTSKDLTAAWFYQTEPSWEKCANPNLWMEDRFAPAVPDDCLYIPETVIQTGQLQIGLDGQGALTVKHGEPGKGLFVAELKSIAMNTLDTPERIIADAHYTARHNQVEIIRGLAAADYAHRQTQVQEWFYKAVAKNLPAILDDLLQANHGRFRLPRTESGRPMMGVNGTNLRHIGFVYDPPSKQHGPDRRDKLRLEHFIGVTNRSAFQWDCYLHPGEHIQANLFITVSTDTIHDIKVLTGLSLSDIPAELHSRGLDIYTGNHNLARLDPLSRIRNPWSGLSLRFRLPVSFKAFKAYRASHGLTTPTPGALAKWGLEGGLAAHSEGLTC